jgi:hypothetical protein
MESDDPLIPEFASWDSYNKFAWRVQRERRYVHTQATDAFLRTVRATIRDRDVTLEKGRIFFRAQQGIDWHERKDDGGTVIDEEPVGFSAERMKPLNNQAREGRSNPAGIPALYLGTTEQTAISEVRPWIGADISVAQFELKRTLKAIDLSRGHGESSFGLIGLQFFLNNEPLSADKKERAVWTDIDNAFSKPVTSSENTASYAPTQVLAELFRDIGYDAVIYKSQFGEKGFNVVLFNLDDAEAINCAPYQVTGIEVSFKEAGNRWFKATT